MKDKIPVLMGIYGDMITKNKEHHAKKIAWKANPNIPCRQWNPYDTAPFSDTMLHSIIVIINKLNNQ